MSGAVSVVRGAIDPLLAYLSSAIRDEAQLLGGVRRDAQFIKDEMESMNGFLHHLAEAGNDNEGDHQVRAWMKQVRDLAYDTQDCVDLYARRVGPAPPVRGVWGQLRRGLFFLQTIPARHQVATQIRELKSRARDIGERRLRYGVMVPAKETHEFAGRSSGGDAMVDEAHAHRRSLVVVEPDILKAGTVVLVNWLKKLQAEEPVGQDDPSARRPVVIAVVAPDAADGADLAKEVYEHSSVASMFDCKAWVCIQRPPFLWQVLDDMIHKLPRAQHEAHQGGASDAEDNIELQKRLKGRRFLVVIEEADHPYPWDKMKEILDSSGCSPGSVIMLTTKDSGLAEHCSPSKTRVHSLVQFCFEKADQLIPTEYEDDYKRVLIRRIMKKCDPDVFCMKLLLGTLYADPHMSKKQLEDLCTSLESSGQPPDDSDTSKQHIRLKMMKFCYDKLPKMDRSCLLYLSIYPPNMKIRRTSLVRRWVAEGHVTEGDGREALDRAEGCFDDLVAQGFVDIAKAGNLGNVVSCKVQDIVRDFIVKIVRDENFGDASLPPKLARHLSISSDIQWHQVLHKLKQKQQQGSGYICNCFSTVGPPEAEGAPESDEVTTFLESLPAFSGVAARVKVMDLDFCRHLKNMHLKIICNNLFMLKYLSIMSTEISGLPSREINKLQQLETLDIRQTKVPSSATKDLFLPMLKHLLAGPVGYQVGVSPEETLSTVLMPNKIGRMTKMETLIYVEVAEDDKELKNVKNLKCLKSLGVVIHGKQDNVNHLLRVVAELSEHLRKLSVWVRPPRQTSNAEGLNMNLERTQSFPKFLEILRINGITKGLPNWIEELPHLAEITLRKTSLSDDSMRILGKLERLRCLTLRHESYIENKLSFKANEFKNIHFLVIESASTIKSISFEAGTAPKLAKIEWTFTSVDFTTDTIIGLNELPSLKELELNGEFDPNHVQQAVANHPNCLNFRYNTSPTV
ncbi:hypothetical protein ZWY2020_017242 [Hordeum vulgare]|nr:hypothetical protein ZWY2020_017242 [Hordeum vulgare]